MSRGDVDDVHEHVGRARERNRLAEGGDSPRQVLLLPQGFHFQSQDQADAFIFSKHERVI